MTDRPPSYSIEWTSKSGKKYLRVGIGEAIKNSKYPDKYVDCMLIEDEKSKYAKLYMVGDKNDGYNKMLKLIAREYLKEIGYKIKSTHYTKVKQKSPKTRRKKEI